MNSRLEQLKKQIDAIYLAPEADDLDRLKTLLDWAAVSLDELDSDTSEFEAASKNIQSYALPHCSCTKRFFCSNHQNSRSTAKPVPMPEQF